MGRPLKVAAAAILVLAVAAPAVVLSSCVTNALGGAFSRRPEELGAGLSPGAAALLARAFEGLDPRRIADYHVHLAGLGAGGSGNWVNPKMRSWLHPVNRFKFDIYLSAAAVKDLERADEEYVERLAVLARNFGGRQARLPPDAPLIEPPGAAFHLLAFDKRYLADGTVDDEGSEFLVTNEWVFSTCERHPDVFRPVASVHPYRKDAVEALERCARRGARLVKWLPNAMGIDPADPRGDPFYRRMKELGLVLLTHAGEEQAVDAEEDQKLGNPLRLRRPLDMGVRVIVAHCASLGDDDDLDAPPGEDGERPRVPSFDLFLRLMDDPKYKGLVFGEISAMTQFNRVGRPLETMLDRTDLHARLVNGSDYPLPAINALVRTGTLERAGFITEEERERLNEIYDFNPLLYDFALKRTLRSPKTGRRFAASVFMENPALR